MKMLFRVVVELINNLFTINSLIFSLNELFGNIVKSVDKAYVHRLDARKTFNFNLFRIPPE